MLNPQVPVAKEGYPFIALGAFLTLFFATLSWLIPAWICLFITLFVLSFFRDPERFTPIEADQIISPADGKVIISEKVSDDTFTGGEAYKVSIFMNVFNVHVNRNPASGTIENVIYKPGKFYSADSEKGALENEYCGCVMQTDTGHRLAYVQIAGLIARRIICWLEPGDRVTTGRRFGLIRFGSRVDLYLPLDAELKIQVGEKVRAGETVLAKLSTS